MSTQLTSEEFVLRYPFQSEYRLLDSARPQLRLASALTQRTPVHFFEGSLAKARVGAVCLLSLAKLAGTRFHTPPNMVARLILESDPVITCSDAVIRFESFSSCASAYARVDVSADAYAGEFFGKGTTNVDFNAPLRNALSAFSGEGKLDLSIGADDVKISANTAEFVERKVALPLRWVRSFSEVAACQSLLEPAFEVNKVNSIRFLQSLPGTPNEKADYYVVCRRGELSITQKPSAESVKLAALSRLKFLRALAPHVDRMKVFGNAAGDATSWLIWAGPYVFEFVLSADSWRGFSGEGRALTSLAQAPRVSDLAEVRAWLNWQNRVDAMELAKQLALDPVTVQNCLRQLGTNGLVGFDSSCGNYFHRELPFNAERIVKLNPRLKGAKQLIDNESIEIVASENGAVEAEVDGSGVKHIVKLAQDGAVTCTCVWYAKHQGARGPCKHVLSLHLLIQERDERN